MTNSQVDIDAIVKKLTEYVQTVKTPIIDLVTAETHDPFKILIGTVLSARTKDETTAKCIERLFAVVNTPNDLVGLSIPQIEKLIFPVGFYHQKAKNLHSLAQKLINDFNSCVPATIDEMLTLPGVGRKTANLVMIMAFDKPAMCVDTHVHRISNRFGYIQTKTPAESELALRQKLPLRHWKVYNSLLVAFGQSLCKPINPKCDICPVNNLCNKINVGDGPVRPVSKGKL